MFIFVSIAIIVLLAAICVSHALLKPTRALLFARGTAALALAVGGVVADVAARLRFASLEAYDEWARNAFAQFSKPLVFSAAVAVLILSASVLTAKKKIKIVICLAAAAAFALLVFGYTALFAFMTEGGALSVDRYVRILGCAVAACFGAVGAAADVKSLILMRREKSK